MKLELTLQENMVTIEMTEQQGTIHIYDHVDQSFQFAQSLVFFLLKDRQVEAIGITEERQLLTDVAFDQIITIIPTWGFEISYLKQIFVETAIENKLKFNYVKAEKMTVPASQQATIVNYQKQVAFILEKFGYHLSTNMVKKSKGKHAKTRHRWSKEVSTIEFYVNTRESKATVLWQKRNEMLLKAGATIMIQPPLNKDGSLGFSAKMGERIRADHKDKIQDGKTTENIILKSVNEIGLFLYFGGTNSWLELIDNNGKTIDAWTRID